MDAREQKILDTVDGLAEEIVDFTARLTREPSVLGAEHSAVDVFAAELDRLGLAPRRVPMDYERLAQHPGFAPAPWTETEDPGRANVVGVVEPAGTGGKSAIFNGHLDVVSPEPVRLWATDPFEPKIENGWMYGRGAGDMKAGVAAMAYAAYAVGKAGFGLCAPLTVEGVIEEECSGNGALACRRAGIDAEAVLIPEPFGAKLYTAQVGVYWFKVAVSGRPVHVLEAGAGANALEKCYPLILALRELEAELNEAPRPGPYKDMNHPLNLNVGIFHGGDWPSTVAADAEFHCRISAFPGTTFDEVRELIEATVARAAAADPWLAENPPRVEFYGFRSGGHVETREAAPLSCLDGVHASLTGEPCGEYVSTCTTDLRAFYSFGRARGCCYGPVAESIHGADERVHLDSVVHTARAYALFAARWCKLAE